MEFKIYIFKYYLNTMHSANYMKEHAHRHTFTISFYLEPIDKECFNKFEIVDDMLKEFFRQYTDKYLNEVPPFDQSIPTIEIMGEVFYEKLKVIFINYNYNLIQLEISETPVRVYAISDRLFIGNEVYIPSNMKSQI